MRAFPVFISLMTSDRQTVFGHVKSRSVKILRDVISDDDRGGTDLHIADPDGNGIQVVQYLELPGEFPVREHDNHAFPLITLQKGFWTRKSLI